MDRTGLQKKVSAIFDGAPIPKKKEQSSRAGEPARRRTRAEMPRAVPWRHGSPAVPRPARPMRPLRGKPSDRLSKITGVPQRELQVDAQPDMERPAEKASIRRARSSSTGQKIKVAVVILLVIALFLALLRAFEAPSDDSGGSAATDPAQSRVMAQADIRVDWADPPAYPQDIRDPMESGPLPDVVEPTVAEADTLKPIVRGIVYSDDRPCAVIGTELAREGDVVLGATVLKIYRSSVEFEMDGQKWTQEVQGEQE